MNLPQNLLHSIDLWTKDDVKKWFEYCIEEYSLGDINLNDFQMNGKALLLLNEDGFKQRSLRSGDILHKALQKHHGLIKSLTCQSTFPYQFWNNLSLPSSSFLRHFNIPFAQTYMHPTFHIPDVQNKQEEYKINPKPSIIKEGNDTSRQIRYYQDRIDFHGEILMKPKAGKNCRILWEFLYILLEDTQYDSIIHWENREKMIFRIIQADKLAALWGLQKNRLSMTYEKLSRGMRYYYSNNIISKEQSKRLLYRFMRSPDEIRQSVKRQTTNSSSPITNSYLQLFSINSINNLLYSTRKNSIGKSDRSSTSSPESLDSEKHYSHSSSIKRKQTIPRSLTNRLSHDQPLNLAVPKEEKNSDAFYQ